MDIRQITIGKKEITSFVTFVIFGCIALYFCWWQSFYPSMDGPAHFYNSRLLKEYFSGNQVVQTNFSLTSFYNPNLFSTYFIATLYCFFSFKTAAFIFFFLYFLCSFYSVKALFDSYKISLSPLLSLGIILFFNSLLFNLGFYNFSWSVNFLFFIIAFLRNYLVSNKKSPKAWVLYGTLLLLVYYTNAITFVFYLLYLIVYEASQINWKNQTGLKTQLKKKLPFFLTNLLVLSPFIILLTWFYLKSPLSGNTQPNNIGTYNELLTDMSSMVVYGAAEKKYTHMLFYLFLMWFLVACIIRLVKKEFVREGDFFFLLAGLMLLAFYIVPDNSGVGMMSVRFQHFFYLFLLVWLLIQRYTVLAIIGTAFVMYFSVQKYRTIHKDILIKLDENARAINESAKVIEPNSSVASYDYTGNWLTLHFSNYLGIDKPVITTENYEANVGWFPLTWNYKNAPVYTFNNEDLVPDPSPGNRKKEPVKYIMVFGNIYAFRSDSVRFNLINDSYNKVYQSEPLFVEVYKLK